MRSPTAPVAPSSQPTSTPSALENFFADATVLTSSGPGGCGWGRTPGETRLAVAWRVTLSGATIELDEDMGNYPTDHIPFTGTLQGLAFSASYHQGADYARYTCQFREAWIFGSFSEDFDSFEAHETLFWGPPEQETRVERRWTARRIAP